MSALRDIVAALGCQNVKTFIQSGNVVFDLGSASLDTLPYRMEEAVHAQFGFRPPVILRSTAELLAIVNQNPFLPRCEDPKCLHVAFLSHHLSQEQSERLKSLDVSPDETFASGKEIYLRLAQGVHLSRLTHSNFYSKIGVHTVRNWQSTLKLAELANQSGPAVG